MKTRTHEYDATVAWTGNHGSDTSTYNAYGREHGAQRRADDSRQLRPRIPW